ncbi:dodecin [Rubinisphaera margarita]|uniref:dodecin n=1 Tax=Rubinisphaera margarita TaxID=2909586 RepID=UPI001EE919BC|nr:dodecin [Rubinisphaera margarita]MCG6157429.1 dodecin family protein [Rubinisphaera margarita]
MSDHVYKKIEIVGSSTTSSDDAIRNALAKASSSVSDISWYEVVEHRGHIVDGKIAHFQVTVKFGFRIND